MGREISDKLRFKKINPYLTGETILDVGSTSGFLHKELVKANPNKKIYTLDIEGNPDFKINLNKKWNLRKKFDTIILGEIIEHIENPTNLILNMYQHLRGGGRLILTTPNAIGLQYIRNPSWCVDVENMGHINAFTMPMLECLMKKYKIIHKEYINAFWMNRNPLQIIPLIIPRLKTDLLIVGEK